MTNADRDSEAGVGQERQLDDVDKEMGLEGQQNDNGQAGIRNDKVYTENHLSWGGQLSNALGGTGRTSSSRSCAAASSDCCRGSSSNNVSNNADDDMAAELSGEDEPQKWRLMGGVSNREWNVYAEPSTDTTPIAKLHDGAIIEASEDPAHEEWLSVRKPAGWVQRQIKADGWLLSSLCPLVGTWDYTFNSKSHRYCISYDPELVYTEHNIRIPLHEHTSQDYQPPPERDFPASWGGSNGEKGIWFDLREGILYSYYTTYSSSQLPTRVQATRAALDKQRAASPIIGEECQVPPGKCGLANLGNTCFMNSAIQCVSSCKALVDYLANDAYKKDLNRLNPLGAKGKLAEEFSQLLRIIWSGNYANVAPTKLKNVIDVYAPRFSGCLQHDSHELLSFLLDGLHEDVNTIKDKPYHSSDDDESHLSENEKAQLAWSRHRERNKSRVADLFEGQLRSVIRCNKCGHRESKFDPMTSISLPCQLESSMYSVVSAYVCRRDIRNPIEHLMVKMKSSDDVGELKRVLAEKLGLEGAGKELVCSDGSNTIGELVQRGDNVVLLEPELQLTEDGDPTTCLIRLTLPFPEARYRSGMHAIRVNHSITIGEAHDLISAVVAAADPGSSLPTNPEEPAHEPETNEVKIEDLPTQEETPSTDGGGMAVDGCGTRDSLETEEEVEKEQPVVYKAGYSWSAQKRTVIEKGSTSRLFEQYDPKEVYVEVQLRPRPEVIHEENAGVLKWKEESQRVTYKTIEECLEKYTEEEQLDEANTWYCPKCKSHVRAYKMISVWKLPEYLVVHLNRFSFSNSPIRGYYSFGDGGIRSKVDTDVRYGAVIDLSPSVCKDSPISGTDMQYELNAVSCHVGSAMGGHYTAYSRASGSWCHYNDRWVSPSTLSESCNSSAYLLFYSRRNPIANGTTVTNGHSTPTEATAL